MVIIVAKAMIPNKAPSTESLTGLENAVLYPILLIVITLQLLVLFRLMMSGMMFEKHGRACLADSRVIIVSLNG